MLVGMGCDAAAWREKVSAMVDPSIVEQPLAAHCKDTDFTVVALTYGIHNVATTATTATKACIMVTSWYSNSTRVPEVLIWMH